jgi:hypothetical protein
MAPVVRRSPVLRWLTSRPAPAFCVPRSRRYTQDSCQAPSRGVDHLGHLRLAGTEDRVRPRPVRRQPQRRGSRGRCLTGPGLPEWSCPDRLTASMVPQERRFPVRAVQPVVLRRSEKAHDGRRQPSSDSWRMASAASCTRELMPSFW